MPFAAGQVLTASALNGALGLQTVPGSVIRGSNSSSTSGSVEMAWATTGSLSLAASTTYIVVAELYLLNSANAADLYIGRIRDTNTSGTIRQAIDIYPTTTFGPGPYSVRYAYTFTTTTATTYTACATIVRSSGSDTVVAVAGSSLIAYALGASSVLTTI